MPRCRIRWRPAPSRCSSWGRWPAGERLAMRVSRVALAGGLSLALLIVVGCIPGQFAGFLPTSVAELGDITLPPGFRIELYAADVPNARQMAAGTGGPRGAQRRAIRFPAHDPAAAVHGQRPRHAG